MAHTKSLAFVDCQILCRAYNILDLAPVEILLGQFRQVVISQWLDLELAQSSDALQKHLENRPLGLGVKIVISQSNMDS